MTSAPGQPPGAAGPQQSCPECHAVVPAGTAFCPNCGADLRPRRRGNAGWIVLGIVVALLAGGAIAYALASSGVGSKTTTIKTTIAPTQTLTTHQVTVTTPTQTVTRTATTTTTSPTTTTTPASTTTTG